MKIVANGTEKYLVIGNFKTDAATTTSATGVSSGVWSEYFIDDVSVIDYNLLAYAGPDKNIFLGDSAFIGRPPEIGLECTWTTGTTTVGNGGGIWVKPPLGTAKPLGSEPRARRLGRRIWARRNGLNKGCIGCSIAQTPWQSLPGAGTSQLSVCRHSLYRKR